MIDPEPLLLPELISQYRGSPASHGPISGIMKGLLDSDRTDAERAGERLLVFGWQGDPRPEALAWVYRVVGEDSGLEYASFTLTVPGAPADLPCRVLGLQLQITLNGIENTLPEELDCYMELAAASRPDL